MDEHRWLRTVEVVNPASVRDESEPIQLVHKVLQSRISDIIQFGCEETLEDPEGVPIVCSKRETSLQSNQFQLYECLALTLFSESTTGNDERVVQRDQAALTA